MGTGGGLLVRTTRTAGDGPVVATFECEAPGGEWSAVGDVSRGDQGLVITRLEVRPGADAAGGITGGTLQKVPVGKLLRAVRADLGREARSDFPAVETKVMRRTREGGRVTVDDDLLVDVAFKYWFYTQPQQPPGAIRRMAEEYGRPEETVRTWVSRARRDGWLGPSVKGRAGAEMGPRLVARARESAQAAEARGARPVRDGAGQVVAYTERSED